MSAAGGLGLVAAPQWQLVLLDSVAKRGSGHTPDKKHPEYWNGDIKWLSLKDSDQLDNLYIADTAERTTPAGIANSSAVEHPCGTVVLSRDAGVGKSAITQDTMAVSQHFMAWQCGERLHNHFLYYWLQHKKPEFERIAIGNTIKTIGLPYFKALEIPLPQLSEQQAIAAALGDMDALIGAINRLIAKKRDVKQAAMQQLLTGQTRLPGFSGARRELRLVDVATVLKGRDLGRADLSSSGERKCILYGELFTTYGRVIASALSRTNNLGGTTSRPGDVLLPASTTTVGADLAIASALLEGDVALGGDINVVRSKRADSFDPIFMAYYLTTVCGTEIAERAQGITIIHLYGRDILSLPVRLPPLQEQQAIALTLNDVDAEITALVQRRDKTRLLKEGMMQELLTGRTRLV